jgi:hypothetical protein
MSIKTTGNEAVDTATAEIAVALRNASPGKRDQHYYDEAMRLRDEIRSTGTSAMESKPMRKDELGRYVCVAHGGCLHSPHITINDGGVWVRSADPLNPGSHLYSSAHRDCFEAWRAREVRDLPALPSENLVLHGDQVKSIHLEKQIEGWWVQLVELADGRTLRIEFWAGPEEDLQVTQTLEGSA